MADDYAELVKRWRVISAEIGNPTYQEHRVADDMADAIETLVKEWSELALELLTVIAQRDGDDYGPSDFQRGREAGIREAAAIAEEWTVTVIQTGTQGNDKETIEEVANSVGPNIADAILALIDKPQERNGNE